VVIGSVGLVYRPAHDMYNENFTKYPNTRPKLVIGYTVRHKTCARKGIMIYVWHNEWSMEKEHTQSFTTFAWVQHHLRLQKLDIH
jgi:hypothetical protein